MTGSACWIAHVTVPEPEAYGGYAAIAPEAIAVHGGTFLARSGACRQLEGRERARNVVIRLPSLATAEAGYASPLYREGLAHARGASERDLVIVEAV